MWNWGQRKGTVNHMCDCVIPGEIQTKRTMWSLVWLFVWLFCVCYFVWNSNQENDVVTCVVIRVVILCEFRWNPNERNDTAVLTRHLSATHQTSGNGRPHCPRIVDSQPSRSLLGGRGCPILSPRPCSGSLWIYACNKFTLKKVSWLICSRIFKTILDCWMAPV